MSGAESHAADREPNRLIREQSPYLRQHAYNPVDWHPWSEEALAKARAENKPILLSIGYSACHWCHVMERESFEDKATARLMNDLFVPIKVDREERPDLDQIYMDAVQLLAGRGGWPLTMFLTPAGEPFFGGTYFPPEDRHGLPAFRRVLTAVAEAWRERRGDVEHNVERLGRALHSLSEFQGGAAQPLTPALIEQAAAALAGQYDHHYGGIGQAPKFPNSFVFSLFLRVQRQGGGAAYGEMVADTLTHMAKGGVYDQIGGGFHRYSVDQRWLVPHFEKMLYDNALLCRLYLDAARALDRQDFLTIAREICDYVLREMTSPEGGFYATQDADSEGEEGKFFVWTPAEVEKAAGPRLAPLACRYFDVTGEGNFEGRNILHRTIDLSDAARLFGISEQQAAADVEEIRRKLFQAREARIKPGRDEKVLAAWNGLMIGALAEAYRVLGSAPYLEAARRAVDFVMTRLWDGRALRRSFKDGVARFNAYLEDYGILANAFIDVYEATLERRYLELAEQMAAVILERFCDHERGGFYFTSEDHERLVTRSKPAFDGSTPSGNSEAILVLLRLFNYTGRERLRHEAEKALQLFAAMVPQQPFAFAHMLEVIDLYVRGPSEVVLVGPRAQMGAWWERLSLLYVPNRALFAIDPEAPGQGGFIPEAARGKEALGGRLTGYVCRNFSCSPPRATVEELEEDLKA